MSKQYYAVRTTYDTYEISNSPGVSAFGMDEFAFVSGPFISLRLAKEQVKEWIKADRDRLNENLKQVMNLKAGDV